MALPISGLPKGSVDVGGTKVDIKSLSRSQALKMQEYKGREDEAENFVLMCGTGCTEAEAQEFRDNNDVETAGLLIEAILRLSGVVEPNPK